MNMEKIMKVKRKGFTLIELMVTVAIVAILAAIAIPSYSSYVRKTHRADAKAAVMTIATAMEKYLLQNNTYTTTLTELSGLGEIDRANGLSSNGMYALQITASTATAPWQVSATAVAGTPQAEDTECRTFVYRVDGTQSATSASNVDTTATCWN